MHILTSNISHNIVSGFFFQKINITIIFSFIHFFIIWAYLFRHPETPHRKFVLGINESIRWKVVPNLWSAHVCKVRDIYCLNSRLIQLTVSCYLRWTVLCLIIFGFVAKVLLQLLKSHLYPIFLWIKFWWDLKCDLCRNLLSQPLISHLYGFSPECTRLWYLRAYFHRNTLVHQSQSQ